MFQESKCLMQKPMLLVSHLLFLVVNTVCGNNSPQECIVVGPEQLNIPLCTVFPIRVDCGDHTKLISCLCPSSLTPIQQSNFLFNVITKNSTEGNKLENDFRLWKFPTDHRLYKTFPVDSETRNFVRQVRNAVFSIVHPTPFKSGVTLASVSNITLMEILDLSPSVINSQDFVNFVSGQQEIPSSTPLAHRYGGHQFGYWADQLGDGRATMLGEYVNQKGQRWELQLKGSGLTPYSRRGDGRAVIRSSVREFLCSEAMYHLGIPTSRAASLVISNDTVIRDQFYNGNPRPERTAVVLRLAQSWFRIGSLEILTESGETDLLRQVVDFVIAEYFRDIDPSDSGKNLAFFQEVVRATASLIALWQSVGFTHGVCNTDNFSLLSITIDYGPFGFLDAYDPLFVPNTSDDEHRYSYENQPEVGAYNLEKLRLALLPLWTNSEQVLSQKVLLSYGDHYRSEFMRLFRDKLGLLTNQGEEDEQLVAVLLRIMSETGADFTMTFRELSRIPLSDLEKGEVRKHGWALSRLVPHDWFSGWVRLYIKRLRTEKQTDHARQERMLRSNPRYILRNWIAQLAIEGVEKNDFSMVNKLYDIFQKPYTEQEEAELLGLADPLPDWASSLKVSCSS